MNIGVEILDEGWLEAIGARVQQTLAVACIDAVDRAVTEAAEEARRTHTFQNRTGALERSIDGRLTNVTPKGATGEVVATADYASFVEYGTPPHRIEPKAAAGAMGPLLEGQSRLSRSESKALKQRNRVRGYGYAVGGRVLSWIGGDGVRVFARGVNHPGGRAMPFMGPAFLKAERVGERELEAAMPRAQGVIDRA